MDLKCLTIDRVMNGGRYSDVIDAVEFVAESDGRSGISALAQIVRQSPLFKAAIKEVRVRDRAEGA